MQLDLKLKKYGNSYVVVVPKALIDVHKKQVGDTIIVTLE
jgi:antitoxin component of MazEF toxin-antitoxin module